MATEKEILTGLYGRRIGLSHDGSLVVNQSDTVQLIFDENSLSVAPDGVSIVTQDGRTVATGNAITQLGALAPAVQTLIDTSIAANNPVANQLSNKTGILPSTQVGSVTVGANSYSNVQLAINAIYALIQPGGATAPVPNAAPSVAFPGGTGDVGETATITPGSYTVATPTSVSWNVTVNGSVVLTTASTSFIIPASAGVSPRSLSVTEVYVWSQAPLGAIGKTSATYTINAPAAVPVIVSAASLSGTAQVGQVLTGSVGSWTNTPTGYVKTFYRNGVSIATTTSAATTLSYTLLAADAGASITFGTVATNAAGSSIESISTALVIAGGVAPSWTATGAVQPGWVNQASYQVGVLMTADVGAAANNPAVAGYSYQMLRDGTAILGASGSNVSGFTYLPVSADQDHQLSFTLTASNAAGSATTTAASVTINAAVGGGGGTASFVGSSNLGTNSVASATIAPPAAIQNLDFGLLIQTNNGPVSWNAPTGTWTQDGTTQVLTTIGEEAEVWTRVLSGSEPASYTISPSTAQIFGAIICAWRGPTSVVARNVNKSDAANASPVVPSWLTVTPTAANQTVVLVGILDNSAAETTTWTPPAGYTLRAQQDFSGSGTGASGQWASIVIFDKVVSTTAATGTLTASAATTAGTAGWITFTLVLG